MKKKLLVNTVIISIGKICTQLITFLLLPLYTNLLSTEEYGIADLVTVFIMLVVPIVTLQIEQGVYRELIEVRENDSEKSKIISNTFITTFLQIVLYTIIFLVVSLFIKNEYKYFLLFNTIAYIFSSILLQISRGLDKNIFYSIGSFICAISTIIFNIIFLVVFKMGAYGMLIGNLLGYISNVVFLLISLNIFKYIKIRLFNMDLIIKILKYSIPLVPNAICWWIFSASDRMIVNAILGVSSVGILAAALKFSNLLSSMYSVFHISWVESISLNIKKSDGKQFFNEMLNVVFFMFCSISLMMISVMPFVFSILVDKNYYFGFYLLPISIVASLANIMVSLVTAVYYGFKDSKSIAKTSLYAAILNVIIHFVLIKYIGLYAAPVSTLCAYLLVTIFRIIDINKKYLKIRFDLNKISITILFYSLIILFYYLNNYYFNILSILLSILYLYLMNNKSIFSIFELIKKRRKQNE